MRRRVRLLQRTCEPTPPPRNDRIVPFGGARELVDGEMRTILEWRYNNDYSMTITPVRYGETGIRSYFIEPNGGMARPWITPDRPQVDRSILAVPLEAPMCDWVRGRRCDPPRPNPNDGGFGPGLLTILHADMYKVH